MKKLILLLAILTSCSVDDPLAIQDLDIIIIDPANEDFYKINHANNSGMGWVETPNKDKYTYHFNGNNFVITSDRKMSAVYKMKSPGKEQVEIKENQFIYPIEDLTTFRIYY